MAMLAAAPLAHRFQVLSAAPRNGMIRRVRRFPSMCFASSAMDANSSSSSSISSTSNNTSSSSSSNNNNLSRRPPPIHKMFDYMITRPDKDPNYLLWGGLAFAFLMRGEILEEIRRWPTFTAMGYRYLLLARDAAVRVLLQHAKQPYLWTLNILSWAFAIAAELYALVLEATPVWALLRTMLLCCALISVGEAARSRAADQPKMIAFVSLVGAAAALDILDSAGMLALLLLSAAAPFAINRKKADAVTALLPPAAVLVAVTMPSVQVATFVAYTALAIYANWAAPEPQQERAKARSERVRSPPLLVAFAIAVALNVAASWVGARHVLWLAKATA